MSGDNVLIWNDDTGCWCSPARGNCRGVSELHLMGQFPLGQSGAARWLTTLRDLMLAGFCLLFVVGCNSTVSPEIADRAAELSSAKSMQSAMESHATALATALAAQKLTGEMTLENTQAIIAKLNTLEASLSAPKPNGQEVIKSAPEPPAKANTAATPSQVATPGAFRTASDGTRLRWNIEGNWNPTILETSAHLGREHGIDTNGMTHQEMADIHAALHDGKTEEQAVSGAMFQRRGASSIVSKSSVIRPISRRGSSVQWSYYSTQQSCPSGRCPQRR